METKDRHNYIKDSHEMNNNFYCVIMAGGVGSRFWPVSRNNMPKQFLDILGIGKSFIQLTYDRFLRIVPEKNIFVVTSSAYADLVHRHLPALPPENILTEPYRRNTAPCIAYAATRIRHMNPEATMVVAPSDHFISNENLFVDTIACAMRYASQKDELFTLGIDPTRPETGYGYIQVSKEVEDECIVKVKTFTEKPNAELAKVFVKSGEFFWNSGIFLWSANAIIDAFHDHCPDIAMRFDKGLGKFGTAGEIPFIEKEFPACPNISVDYAIMEKNPNVYVQCVDIGWSDLGSWGAYYENSPKGENHNVTRNCRTVLSGCEGNLFAAKQEKLIVASGLKDYIIADNDDILLICPLAEEQKIKQYVNEVKANFGDRYL